MISRSSKNSIDSSKPSIGMLSLTNERTLQEEKKNFTIKCKFIFKIILLLLSIATIVYLISNYQNFNSNFPNDLYIKIIKNYDSIVCWARAIDIFSNYHIFIFFFILGFCKWNLYKSYIHILGFFICEYTVFFLKLIFKKLPVVLDLEFDKKILSPESLNSLCGFTSEFECPSYRAAYVIYSNMSFISLLFKEKKLKKNKKTKIIVTIIFVIISLALNTSLILLLQSTISSIIIGTSIGFIIYFFTFSLLKIDYDRNEQLLAFLDVNIFYYVIINVVLFTVMLVLDLFIDPKEEEINKYNHLCGNTSYNYKKLDSETFFKSLFFYCNLIMIISIKLQRKLIFKKDGYFVSRNFYVNEIIDQNTLLSKIKNEETYKFDKVDFIKYICKVLIILGISLIVYLIFVVIKYFREKNYILLSIIAYVLPINLLVVFLFLFSKRLFIYLDLEFYNDE
jgi:hypothetical protein